MESKLHFKDLVAFGVLGRGKAVFLLELPGEMVDAGKPAAFGNGGYCQGCISQQTFGLLDAQIQNILLGGGV